MKKSTYFITVSVMSILICLISGALYAYCKDINIHNYSLDKIKSNNVEIININKEIEIIIIVNFVLKLTFFIK